MSRRVSPPGMTSREKIRIVGMLGILVVGIFVVIAGLRSFTDPGDAANAPGLVDPDEAATLPEFDRGPLASVVDESVLRGDPWSPLAQSSALDHLLGLVREGGTLATAGHRGYRWPSAAELLADPAAHRGEYVKVIGRLVEVGALGGAEGVSASRLVDADGEPWVVFSTTPPGAVEEVVKVSGVFLLASRSDGEQDDSMAPGPVVVAIRTEPSVMPERFLGFDPRWVDLVPDGTQAERMDLRTQPVWWSLAWARTLGPQGAARAIETKQVFPAPMPTAEEIKASNERLRGRWYRLRGIVDGIEGDHDLPPNPAGLESVYNLRILYDRGGRKQWQVAVLAPRGALPDALSVRDRVVVEGVYLKVWRTTDTRGRLIDMPLLISPRVRLADGGSEVER